jgi:hypothetical protein
MESKEKKIIIAFFGIILFFILFLVFFVFVVKSNSLRRAEKEKYVPTQSDLFSLAVASKDEAQCQTLADKSLVPLCLSEMKDIILYESALSKQDASICAGIVGQSRKDACLSVLGQSPVKPENDSLAEENAITAPGEINKNNQ